MSLYVLEVKDTIKCSLRKSSYVLKLKLNTFEEKFGQFLRIKILYLKKWMLLGEKYRVEK